jgi:hypothetical protein
MDVVSYSDTVPQDYQECKNFLYRWVREERDNAEARRALRYAETRVAGLLGFGFFSGGAGLFFWVGGRGSMGLFGVEYGDWIEAHGAERRDVAGGDGDGGEHNGDANEGP